MEKLLNSIKETPFTGIGKPEPLKHGYAGKWSRGSVLNIVSFTKLEILPFLFYLQRGITPNKP
ncbi:type II toxin-antitoxin system YoeB family toxin [Mucilaginibacter ginsenosidivorans]|uniref:type II toxin-antitoxin system YoeB family toxin n=1 Tax=Mucilaginibacter ginsenosidivorans TaxID=398053 RepID=UPI0035ECEC88